MSFWIVSIKSYLVDACADTISRNRNTMAENYTIADEVDALTYSERYKTIGSSLWWIVSNDAIHEYLFWFDKSRYAWAIESIIIIVKVPRNGFHFNV